MPRVSKIIVGSFLDRIFKDEAVEGALAHHLFALDNSAASCAITDHIRFSPTGHERRRTRWCGRRFRMFIEGMGSTIPI